MNRWNTRQEISANDDISAAVREHAPEALQLRLAPKRFGFGFRDALLVNSSFAKHDDSIPEHRAEENEVEVKSEGCKAPRYDSRSGESGGGLRFYDFRRTEQFRLRQRGHAQPN
jgi:hypothetical protein